MCILVDQDLRDAIVRFDDLLSAEIDRAVLDVLQQSGRAYVSNAVVDGRFVLRACIVNFRTERPDLEALVDEYYLASGLDRRRLTALKKDILDLTRSQRLDPGPTLTGAG